MTFLKRVYKLEVLFLNLRELHHVALVEGIAVIGLILCFTGYRLLKVNSCFPFASQMGIIMKNLIYACNIATSCWSIMAVSKN